MTNNDEDITTEHDISNVNNSSSNIKDTNQWPFTRRRAKKLQEQVNSLLTYCVFMTSKNVILPKYSILVVLRCTHEERAPPAQGRRVIKFLGSTLQARLLLPLFTGKHYLFFLSIQLVLCYLLFRSVVQ